MLFHNYITKELMRLTFIVTLLFALILLTACNSDQGSDSHQALKTDLDSQTISLEKNSFALDSLDVDQINTNSEGFDFHRPTGIYLLSAINATSEIRDYPFVDGYVLREHWANVEVDEGVYDFSLIDEFIVELDAINQKLALGIFSRQVPDYIVNNPLVETYESNINNRKEITTAVPWDPIAIERYQVFIGELGSHKVMSLASGSEVELRNHPVLKILGIQVMGLGGIRDREGVIARIDTYERELFTQGALASLGVVIEEFPHKFSYLPVFGISDDIGSPSLIDHLMDNFNSTFNFSRQPRLGLFAENLACETPAVSPSNVLAAQQDTTFTALQMLQPWQDPFSDPSKTDVCKSDTQGPDIAIQYGYENFNSRYFEIYSDDLNFAGYEEALQEWHDILEASSN